MTIGYILIVLSLINVPFICSAILLLFTPWYYYSTAFAFLSMVLYLTIAIIFCKYTNKYLKKEKENLKSFRLSKSVDKTNTVYVIDFVYVDNKWVCKQNNRIAFALDGYLFKKSFIIARVVREVRYSTISNQIKLIKLLNFRLKINNFDNLMIRFTDNNKIKEFWVVKNHISQNTVLSKAISKSNYYGYFFNANDTLRYLKITKKINEELYLNDI